MKKVFILTLVVFMILAGCSAAGGAAGKLGLGVKTTIDKSTDLVEQKDGSKAASAQVDSVIAAVLVDADGKLIAVQIDSAQTVVKYDENGQVTSNLAETVPTKRELGEAYGMIKASPIGREWYEQIDALQEWMKGKTAAQITGMKVKDDGEGGSMPDEPDLTSKATLTVDSYLEVVAKAMANAQ